MTTNRKRTKKITVRDAEPSRTRIHHEQQRQGQGVAEAAGGSSAGPEQAGPEPRVTMGHHAPMWIGICTHRVGAWTWQTWASHEGSGLRAAGSERPEGAGWAEGPDGCVTRALPVPGAAAAAGSPGHHPSPAPCLLPLSVEAITVTWNFSGSAPPAWATKRRASGSSCRSCSECARGWPWTSLQSTKSLA